LKFAKRPQIKLDKDLFQVNMNMIDLDGKKVLVRPSQAESTKGKEVIIGEERSPMIIKPKSPKDDQWQKNEGGKPQRRPKATFDILMAKYKEGRVGIRGHKNRTIRNTKPDNLVSLSHASTSTTRSSSGKRSQTPPRQKFRRSGSLSAGLSSGAILLNRATNAWGMGTFANDYPSCPPWGGGMGDGCHR
jgi:hypothetical protein